MEAGDPLELSESHARFKGSRTSLQRGEKPSLSTDATASWPEPSDPLGFADSNDATIADLERLKQADRESTSGFQGRARADGKRIETEEPPAG